MHAHSSVDSVLGLDSKAVCKKGHEANVLIIRTENKHYVSS
jgi:hypothetical protein